MKTRIRTLTPTRIAMLLLVVLLLPACTLQRSIGKEQTRTIESDNINQQVRTDITDLSKINNLETTHRIIQENADTTLTYPGQKINAQASLKELSSGSKTIINPDGSSINLKYDPQTKTITAAAEIPEKKNNVRIGKTINETTQKNSTQDNNINTAQTTNNQEQTDRAIKTDTKVKETKNANVVLYIVIAVSILIILLFLFLWQKGKIPGIK